MSAEILYGKPAAEKLLTSLQADIKKLNPKLVIVQVGDDPASTSYIKQKLKSCADVGLRNEHIHLAEKATLLELMSEIEKLNVNEDVTGFIVQLPLPSHLSEHVPQVIKAIDPKKDVDGFGAYNLGKMFLATKFEHLPPATPAGVIALLKFYKVAIEGKHVVIVGHGNVGKPLAVMLLNRNATVTVCHKYTKDLANFTKQADILCSAVGKPGLISKDMVKQGAVCIDIGISRTAEGLKGDMNDDVKDVASKITPVPGGVGPMTVASLIKNCVTAAKRQKE